MILSAVLCILFPLLSVCLSIMCSLTIFILSIICFTLQFVSAWNSFLHSFCILILSHLPLCPFFGDLFNLPDDAFYGLWSNMILICKFLVYIILLTFCCKICWYSLYYFVVISFFFFPFASLPSIYFQYYNLMLWIYLFYIPTSTFCSILFILIDVHLFYGCKIFFICYHIVNY